MAIASAIPGFCRLQQFAHRLAERLGHVVREHGSRDRARSSTARSRSSKRANGDERERRREGGDGGEERERGRGVDAAVPHEAVPGASHGEPPAAARERAAVPGSLSSRMRLVGRHQARVAIADAQRRRGEEPGEPAEHEHGGAGDESGGMADDDVEDEQRGAGERERTATASPSAGGSPSVHDVRLRALAEQGAVQAHRRRGRASWRARPARRARGRS